MRNCSLQEISPFPTVFSIDFYGRHAKTRACLGKVSKVFQSVENTAGKGEIACNEQFLLFPQCFQKTCTPDTLKPGLVWERVKGFFWSGSY